jgi:FkbM family methyltransferase
MRSIELHGYRLDLPDDHWLPQIRRQLPHYSENLGRLAAVVEQKYPCRGLIDVGANVGATAVIVRAHSSLPILCIEGSEIYYGILKNNTSRLDADVELECALVDSASVGRPGSLSVGFEPVTFPSNGDNGTTSRFARLDSILARHPRFHTSKTLKIDTDGMDGRILEGTLEWIAAARPVLFWKHGIGRDPAVGGPGLDIFDRLLGIGYQSAVVFDNAGEFIEEVPLNARQQLADLSEYLPGGEQFSGYCDICVFHQEDLDLCARFRELELETRSRRRQNGAKPVDEPHFMALVEAQFEAQGAHVIGAVQRTLRTFLDQVGASMMAERKLQNAQAQADRYRSQLRITDLETLVSSKNAEIERMHQMLRDMLGARACEREEARLESEGLKAHLKSVESECDKLRHDLDSSVALRAARSLGWLLRPVRKIIGGNASGGRP